MHCVHGGIAWPQAQLPLHDVAAQFDNRSDAETAELYFTPQTWMHIWSLGAHACQHCRSGAQSGFCAQPHHTSAQLELMQSVQPSPHPAHVCVPVAEELMVAPVDCEPLP